MMKVENGNESDFGAPLKREWKSGNKDLRHNNYIAEGDNKVDFMNKESGAFGCYFTRMILAHNCI